MKAVVVLSAFAAAVFAQSGNFSSCCAIDPNTISATNRASWCRAQTNTCPLLCSNGMVGQNTCDQSTLTFQCTCNSGVSPNVSDYSQTLPSLECDEWKRQCINSHPNDLNGQTFCLSFVCGTKNASMLSSAASTTTGAAASSSGGASSTTLGPSTVPSNDSTSTKSAGAAAFNAAKDYGTTGVALGLLALFGLGL